MVYAVVDAAKMFAAQKGVGLRFRSFAGSAMILTSSAAQTPNSVPHALTSDRGYKFCYTFLLVELESKV